MLKTFCFILFILDVFKGEIEPPDGLRENPPGVWALTNSIVHTEPGTILKNATIIIRDGLIENVGIDINIPDDATTLDMSGKTIYPGFIESWVEIPAQSEDMPHHDAHWNFKVHARRELSQLYKPDKKKMKVLHKMGFTAVHIVPDSGVFQGQTALVQLDHKGSILKSDVAQNIAYEVDGWESNNYPNALLGVVALIRQTFIDANWYKDASEKTRLYPQNNVPLKKNQDLQILGDWVHEDKPFIFETDHELDVLRSIGIGGEFQIKPWFLGSGYEYRRIAEITEGQPFFILPIDFPVTPDISHPYQELQYSTAELKHWDIAPDNPGILIEYNIPFALTSRGLKPKEFRKNLSRATKRSLKPSNALASLTTIPAKKMGLKDQLGKIDKGYLANLAITDGDYFDPESDVISVWVGGMEYPVKPRYDLEIEGNWEVSIENQRYKLALTRKSSGYSGKLTRDTTDYTLSKLKVNGHFINWQIQWDSTVAVSRYSGHILGDKMEGTSQDEKLAWTAVKTGDLEKKEEKKQLEIRSNLSVFYPEGTYGRDLNIFKQRTVLVQKTTIWTCSNQGNMKETDILFSDGKVKKIGKKLSVPKGALLIDGTGKHITPGLIDCHSHSAAFSINEGTQSITSEVRIQDVLNSDDITIYRELAGGLTIANILHGSANTIGGQNAVIKLRWSMTPDKLLFENAVPGIKFALGENVKQSNWGDDNTTRYPQTRMGVEQILRDAFATAREYQDEWNDYSNNLKKWKKKVPPRRDLELDALVEILEGKRQIHCHSYRQDEILMLTRVAEDFGFTIGTFQHVLEGYKVADRLAEHGAHASTFSDWWAYKYEVIDAIPYNGAIMTDVGVTVSFNSDSRELARRLNTEAAKGVKYGGLSEEEALKLVTLNPAVQLGIDKWVGSLEVGKDADFVIWNDHPLSTKAVCEQTWIDGVQYFSLKEDEKLKIRDDKLRNKLVNQILSRKDIERKEEWKHYEEKSADHFHCLEN